MQAMLSHTLFITTAMACVALSVATLRCDSNDREVGVCLHVYLERDFPSLQTIVYSKHARRLDSISHGYNVDGASIQRGWLEGMELEGNCRRLRDVLDCFEEVLVNCDTARDFVRFRHLLHALDLAHQYLCGTPDARRNRFVEFLRVIECAENARQPEYAPSCHRHNVTSTVWNMILRLQIGPEICDSLNTQRACLLEQGYLLQSCGRQTGVDIYAQVSGLFLSTWCKIPLLPGQGNIPHSPLNIPLPGWQKEEAASAAALPVVGFLVYVTGMAIFSSNYYY